MGEAATGTLNLEHSVLKEAVIDSQLDNPTTQVLLPEGVEIKEEEEEKPFQNSSEEIPIDIKTETKLFVQAVIDAELLKTSTPILTTETDIKDEIPEMPEEVAECVKPKTESPDIDMIPKDNSNEGLVAEELLFECGVCGRRFKQKNILSIHERVHTYNSAKPYRCKHCGKEFSGSNNLLLHIRRHTGEKPFQCSICKKTFVDFFPCQVHMRTHTGEKPYECELCNKKFAQVSNLTSHMKTHSSDRPFRCDICQRGFLRSCNLTHHLRTHDVPKKRSQRKKNNNNNNSSTDDNKNNNNNNNNSTDDNKNNNNKDNNNDKSNKSSKCSQKEEKS